MKESVVSGLAKRLVLALILLGILLVVGQTTILPGVVEQVLMRTFEQFGYPVQRLTIRTLSRRQADFSDIVLGDRSQIRIDTLQVDFDWRSLMHGEVHVIRLAGAQFLLDAKGPPIKTIPERIEPFKQAIPFLPFRKLDITSSSLLVEQDAMRWRIPTEGRMLRDETELSANASLELLGGEISLHMTWNHQNGDYSFTVRPVGLDPSLLPTPFLPSALKGPVQGNLHGRLHVEQSAQQPWRAHADVSFQALGNLKGLSFLLNQGRLQGVYEFDAERNEQTVQAALSIEEAQLDEMAIRGLTVQVDTEEGHIEGHIAGKGRTWSFGRAHFTLKHFHSLLRPFSPSPQASPPRLVLRITDLAGSLHGASLAAESALIKATLARKNRQWLLDDISAHIQEGSYATDELTGEGIEAHLLMANLFPFALRETQRIRARSARFGEIILRNGDVHVRAEGPRTYTVLHSDWTWCEGRLSARPFEVSLDLPEIRFPVFFEGVSLHALLHTLLPGKIEGQGALYGRMPVRLLLQPTLALSYGTGHLYTVPAHGHIALHDTGIVSEMLMDEEYARDPERWNEHLEKALLKYTYNMLKISLEPDAANRLTGSILLRGRVSHLEEHANIGLTIPFGPP